MSINNNAERAARAARALEAYKANDWRGYARIGQRPAEEGYHLNDDGVWRKDGAPDLREAPDPEEILEAVGDLLGDLRHLLDGVPQTDEEVSADVITGRDVRWDAVCDKGDYHYREEVAEEALEEPEGLGFEASMEARYPLRGDEA